MARQALTDSTPFNLNLFKGKIAQVVVETVLLEFGFLVYPFGYESYFTNLIKSLSGRTEVQATKLRSMPDLVAAEPESARVHILEIKATSAKPDDFRLSVSYADYYRKHWPEADLAVFCIPKRQVYVAPLDDVPFDYCETTTFSDGREAYALTLLEDFVPFPERYDLAREHYDRIMNKMWWQLGKYCRGA